MKRRFRTLSSWIMSGCLVASLGASAQDYPFPQNIDYSFGYKPNGANSSAASTAYTKWKADYVTPGAGCSAGTLRVKFDSKSGRFGISGDNSVVTVSEGIAYGMLLSAYYGDQASFDGFWNYYKKFSNSKGIMNWAINNATNCAIVGQNGATDAELDVAWALWVAYNQFGGNDTYKNGAISLIKAIKAYEIDGTKTLKPGDEFGGAGSGNNNLVNPSYFSPAYYRVFGELTNDEAFWMDVYKRGYDILEAASNPTTGLVPDWSTSQGTVPAPGAATYDNGGIHFFYDAVRAPVRTALDYLWYGDESPRALAFTKKINTWLKGKHPNVADIGSQYSLAGAKLQEFHNNTFMGAFAVSAMATDDQSTVSYLTSLYNDNVTTNPGAGEYFNSSWKAISLFILTGNFYLPPPDACAGPTLLQSVYHLCEGTGTPKALTLNGTATGATKYTWKKDGVVLPSATSATLSVNTAGTYEVTTTVVTNGKNCYRRASAIVYPADPVASFTFTRNGTSVDFKNTSTGGDLLSTPATLSSLWAFDVGGTSASPATATTPNGATNYSNTGSKLVSLTVTNKCGTSASYTATVALPNPSGPGWFATDFTSQSQGYFSAFVDNNVPNPNVTIDATNCKYAVAAVKKEMGRYETVAVTFKKSGGADNPLDVTGYPFATFRIKIETSANATTLFPNGLRVDLVDDTYKASGGATGANIVYLKGPRNANGTYQNIPVNQWFVSTMSFEGKLTEIAATKVLQLAFTPYNDHAVATNKVDYKIYVDWVTVANATLPRPSVSNVTQTVCEATPYAITGASLDSCNADNAVWNDGVTGFNRTLSPGDYSVIVRNFFGADTAAVKISSVPKTVTDLTYSVVSSSPFQIQPIDKSSGGVNLWRWHRMTDTTAVMNNVYSSSTTMLYATNVSTPNQFPAPSPLAADVPNRPGTVFTGTGTEYLCLSTNTPSPLNACTTSVKKCVKVVPSPLGLEDYLNESTFKVYPTYANDKLFVEIGGSLQGNFEVQISTMYGSHVLTTNVHTGINQINLNSGLAAGTYVVNVKRDGQSVVKRFIKE